MRCAAALAAQATGLRRTLAARAGGRAAGFRGLARPPHPRASMVALRTPTFMVLPPGPARGRGVRLEPPVSPQNPPKAIAIAGIGQMGLVSAALLHASEIECEVRMWGHSPEEVSNLAQTRKSPRIKGFEIDPGVRVLEDSAELLDGADLIVSAVPTQFTRPVWERFRADVPPGAGVVSVAKGIENGSLLRPTQVIADVLADDPDAKPRPLATLSGPTIATELAACLPATMIAASDPTSDPTASPHDAGEFARQIQQLFSTSWLRIYTNPDLIGVELAGALKNVIALAAGILDGLKAGNNAKSALLARGLAEIARLGTAMGARTETFFGVAGVGDLATTCFSPEGRNRSCGEALGKGEPLDAYLERSPFVVEGVATTRAVVDLAEKYRVEMPITSAVHAVLFEKLDPLQAISGLMSRELKGERVG